LLGWNGITWGEPELESRLAAFTDPDTFRQVVFDCGQSVVARGDELLLSGCGSGAGKDVWLTGRSLAPLVETLQVTPVWSTPAAVAGEGSDGSLFSPVLLADSVNGFHAFWTQAAAVDGSGLVAPAADTIFYARWDGSRWSNPSPIISSPGGRAGQPAVALDWEGRLLVVWSGGQAGQVYFSWAEASRAAVASEWAMPLLLPAPGEVGSDPDI
jgi:hypothetical protein